jgi:hypothetical protein
VGTWVEWSHVLMRGIFFGAWMFFFPRWMSLRTPLFEPWRNLRSALPLAVFSGIFFGVIGTFEFRLFHWPLALVSVILVFCLIALRLFLLRLNSRRVEKSTIDSRSVTDFTGDKRDLGNQFKFSSAIRTKPYLNCVVCLRDFQSRRYSRMKRVPPLFLTFAT